MRTIKITSIALAGLALFIGCGSTIPAGSKGLYRGWLGGTRETVYKDGFKWHWPWNSLVTYDVRWKTVTERLKVLSADNLHMEVEVALQLRPTEKEVYLLHTEIGPDYYPQVVQQPFRAVALKVLAGYNFDDIPKQTTEIQNKILGELRESSKGKHLDFDSVELRHVEYPQTVIAATNDKLATQQRMEQKEFEKKIADADAQIKIIEAHGQRRAQEIVDSTLTPMYLQFRAIETQRALANNPNTTFYFVPIGKDGLPIIIEAPQAEKKRGNSLPFGR